MKPEFWRCGGGPLHYKYGFGYWAGEQKDLLCIKPNIKTNKEAEKYLSPICKTKPMAFLMFLINRLRGDKSKKEITKKEIIEILESRSEPLFTPDGPLLLFKKQMFVLIAKDIINKIKEKKNVRTK